MCRVGLLYYRCRAPVYVVAVVRSVEYWQRRILGDSQ